MTDKQTDALRLADALERPGYGWHSTPAQCAAELRRQYAELETLRAGYTAARLEIESLQRRVQEVGAAARREHERADRAMRAAQPARAQQPAIMPKGESAAAQLRAMATNYPTGHLWDKLDAKVCIHGALEIEALRASHGQAPAQAVAGPLNELEELNLLNKLVALGAKAAHAHAQSNGDYGHKGTAAYVQWQEMRAEMGELIRSAYAAPTTQPAPQQEAPAMPSGWVSCTIEFDGSGPEEVAYGPKIMMDRLAKWLGKHFERTIAEKAAPQPSPASQDAARLDWLENDVGCRVFHLGKSWYTRANFGMPYRKRASLREAIDAARAAQQEGK